MERHSEEELPELFKICEDLAFDLSRVKGYLHPRALAAASSHIYLLQQGRPTTLENTASNFRISSATLREYLRTYPGISSGEAAQKMLSNSLSGTDLRDALQTSEALERRLGGKKSTVNPAALAAASVYVSYYKRGYDVSMSEIAKKYNISTSTLRDYISVHEEAIDPVQRAKTILSQYAPNEDLKRLHEIVDQIGKKLDISTARIMAAVAYYLYTIESQKYSTIEKVARDFNVSIPALRSYLEPYLASISQTYLLYKKGNAGDIKEALSRLNEQEMEMLKRLYGNYGHNIFELSIIFDIGGAPRGRWQLFIRKISKLGLLDIYKKPLDPKQYFALVKDLANYLERPVSLQRWV